MTDLFRDEWHAALTPDRTTIEIRDQRNLLIASLPNRTAEDLTNAALIAATPVLYSVTALAMDLGSGEEDQTDLKAGSAAEELAEFAINVADSLMSVREGLVSDLRESEGPAATAPPRPR